jgi:hypothetical protein
MPDDNAYPPPEWPERILLVVIPAAILALALWIGSVAPDPRGHGTHERLGMLPCSWPAGLGMPCPTCGVTTAACLFFRGAPVAAFLTQPFGAALAALSVLTALAAPWHLWRNRSLFWRLSLWPLGRMLLGAVLLLLLAWGYKTVQFRLANG